MESFGSASMIIPRVEVAEVHRLHLRCAAERAVPAGQGVLAGNRSTFWIVPGSRQRGRLKIGSSSSTAVTFSATGPLSARVDDVEIRVERVQHLAIAGPLDRDAAVRRQLRGRRQAHRDLDGLSGG